jgi:hypothetical protein
VFGAISRFLRHAKKTQFSNPLTGEEQLAHKSMQRLVEDHAALVHIKLVGRPQIVLVPCGITGPILSKKADSLTHGDT